MRALTTEETMEIRKCCAGLDYKNALIAGGRWMSEHFILHWTSTDVIAAIYGKSIKKTEK